MIRKKHILMVDDEPIIRKTLSTTLADEGFRVETAENGQEAVKLLKGNHFDLMVTDLMMEGMDGISVLKEAKQIDSEIGVIILTGYGDLTSAIDALRLGADDYLLKPCDTDELLFRIAKCFEKQDLQQRLKMYEDILPICLVCKKIRDDSDSEPGEGTWMPVDKFLTAKAGKSMSHGYCPDCGQKFLDEIDNRYK